MGDVTTFRKQSTEDLRVVGGCDCGCTSLDFQMDKTGARIIADALAVYPDGQQAELILWGRAGDVVWLEVNDQPEAPHREPEMDNLRTWEQRGREVLDL